MKKFLNGVDNVVNEMLEGLVKANPSLRRPEGLEVIVRADKKVGKVALVSGGVPDEASLSFATWFTSGLAFVAIIRSLGKGRSSAVSFSTGVSPSQVAKSLRSSITGMRSCAWLTTLLAEVVMIVQL